MRAGVVAMCFLSARRNSSTIAAVGRAVEVAEQRVGDVERVEHRGVPYEAEAIGGLLGGQVAVLHLGDQPGQPDRLEGLGETPQLGQPVEGLAVGDEDPEPGCQLLGSQLFELTLPKGAVRGSPSSARSCPKVPLRRLEGLRQAWQPAIGACAPPVRQQAAARSPRAAWR